MAAKYGTPPSRSLGLTRPTDAWLAYQYDTAASFLGHYIEAKLAETEKRGKKVVAKHSLGDLLRDPETKTRPAQFRSTAGMVGKKL
jgi:hypothetical protein